MNSDLTRKLPVSIEAEQSVLGSILIKPTCFDDITGILTGDDFYLEEHRQIFFAMRSMYMENRQIDAVTLVNTLVKQGVYDESGGINYIKLIADIVPSASNVKDYATIVRDKATLRRLIEACDDINAEAYSEAGEVEHIVDSAEQKIFDIAQKRDTKEFRHIKDVLPVVYRDLENLANSGGAVEGVKTGFSSIDNVLVSMSKGDLVLVGARPGMGKTSFSMNIATSVAKTSKKAVCIFSLEMSCEQIVSRILSGEAMVESNKMRSGRLDDEDWEKLAYAAGELSGTDILVDDTTGITITNMKAKLRRVKNLGLVIIDYLQLMQSDRKIDNRVQEVADISRNLKLMAKDLEIPIICCAQLSRGPEGRTTKKPMLSDLRDSGAIEQDADVVMFLYREDYYKDKDAPADGGSAAQESNTAEVIIAKNRHGATGDIKMGWIPMFTKFITLTNQDEV